MPLQDLLPADRRPPLRRSRHGDPHAYRPLRARVAAGRGRLDRRKRQRSGRHPGPGLRLAGGDAALPAQPRPRPQLPQVPRAHRDRAGAGSAGPGRGDAPREGYPRRRAGTGARAHPAQRRPGRRRAAPHLRDHPRADGVAGQPRRRARARRRRRRLRARHRRQPRGHRWLRALRRSGARRRRAGAGLRGFSAAAPRHPGVGRRGPARHRGRPLPGMRRGARLSAGHHPLGVLERSPLGGLGAAQGRDAHVHTLRPRPPQDAGQGHLGEAPARDGPGRSPALLDPRATRPSPVRAAARRARHPHQHGPRRAGGDDRRRGPRGQRRQPQPAVPAQRPAGPRRARCGSRSSRATRASSRGPR